MSGQSLQCFIAAVGYNLNAVLTDTQNALLIHRGEQFNCHEHKSSRLWVVFRVVASHQGLMEVEETRPVDGPLQNMDFLSPMSQCQILRLYSWRWTKTRTNPGR